MYLQQGDVIFERVETADGKRAEVKNGVLVDGEVTGHAHRVKDYKGVVFYKDDKGNIWVENKQKAQVTHEEHGTITLEPGIWKVGRVQEYDHFLEESKNVID